MRRFVTLGFCFLFLGLAQAQKNPEEILLKDYRPRSIFKIPETRVERAKFPIIDVHGHDYAPTQAAVDNWVKTMDEVGIDKTIIMASGAGARFDSILARYGKHPKRFIIWCGLDYSRLHESDFAEKAVAELVRCHKLGATGVGELSDKGRGLGGTTNRLGIHIDDPRMDPIIQKCAELKMPINIHVAEDRWMYEPMDERNDGLMNAWKWKISKEPGVLQHTEVVNTLENAVKKHPNVTWIACHLANCCSDLERIGGMFDKYPNLYGDTGARFAELSPIPRTVAKFFERYQDRVLYGTDMTPDVEMYRVTFRLMETADEHFYPAYFRKYHWPMHGWNIPDAVLEKIYRKNVLKIVGQ